MEKPYDLPAKPSKDLEADDLDTLANQLSAVMKNPLIPPHLFNAMVADELATMPSDWRTPEAILVNLQELRKTETNDA
jgi:hypothetical protein